MFAFGNEVYFREIILHEKMSTPTAAQIEALLNFLEEHCDLARGNLRSVEGRVLSHRLWDDICTTLNAMGGCTKTTKQWQKVWTDKKYLAKKAAVAARRSAAATGGGPSTAPSLTQWELKVVSIMGDGFGEPQTSARVPAFVEHETPGPSTEDLPIVQLSDPLPETPAHTEPDTQATQVPTARDDSRTRNPMNSSRQQRRFRQRSASLRTDSSVRDRLFQLEEHRRELEEQRNAELAGIRTAIVELCRLVQLFIERQ